MATNPEIGGNNYTALVAEAKRHNEMVRALLMAVLREEPPQRVAAMLGKAGLHLADELAALNKLEQIGLAAKAARKR